MVARLTNRTGISATRALRRFSAGNFAFVSEGINDEIVGSDGDDVIVGTDGDDVINALAGDDTLTGGLSNDTLNGGEGFDTADFSDIDAPINLAISERVVSSETGFSVNFSDVDVNAATGLTDAEFVEEAVAGNLYYNIHTADFPSGEIRGQLFVSSDETDADGIRTIVIEGGLDAAQEPNPTSDSAATGFGSITIVVDADGNATYSNTLDVTGLLESDLLTPVPGAVSAIHLHNAPAGTNGPILQDTLIDAGGTLATAEEVAANPTGVLEDVVANISEIDTLTSIESVIGSGDVDTVDFSQLGAGINVDLDANSGGLAEGLDTRIDATQEGSFEGLDGTNPIGDNADNPARILNDFENVIGTEFNDRIFGNTEVNILQGRGGDDVFHAFAGDGDVYDGGEGTDTALFAQAVGGIRADLAAGIVEAPVNVGENANVEGTAIETNELISIENLTAGVGNDVIIGSDEANVLNGNDGEDIIFGGSGSDTILGGSAGDIFAYDGDPFDDADVSGSDRQIIGEEDFIGDFDFANDAYQLDAVDVGLSGDVNFAALDGTADGASIAAGTNVVVLLNSDDDGNAETPFLAGIAANQIAGLTEADGAGAFVYFNSTLGVNRLVYSSNLNDANADLKVVSRQTDLLNEDAISALGNFSAANFSFDNI